MAAAAGGRLILAARLLELSVAVLILVWAIHFRGGLALSSEIKLQIFNVHPVLVVIGLVLINGEAIMAYKTLSGSKRFKKMMHLTMQAVGFLLSVIGIWAVYKFHNERGIDNFYTLHSWLGLACIFLFALQWMAGFSAFWYPNASVSWKAALLPWHVFLGFYIYALAIASTVTGILEKATFMQHHRLISHYSLEAILLNIMGFLIIFLGGLVAFITICSFNDHKNSYIPAP